MTAREQLRVLVYTLPQLIRDWRERPHVRHYRVAAANEYAKPGVRQVEL